MPPQRIRPHTLLPILILLAVAACTTAGRPIPRHPDPATLDVGAYSVRSLETPEQSTTDYGRVEEAVRLSEALIDPAEADAALTHPIGAERLALMPTPARAATVLAEPVRAVLSRYAMITGASVSGADRTLGEHPRTGDFRGLIVMVLCFPDDAAAQSAAREIDATDAAVSSDNVAVPIPDYPAAYAHWRPEVPGLAATIAAGTSVISVLAGTTTTDLGALTTLAHNAFGAQIRRLHDFTPTPSDRLATLPLDQNGMLARMVPAAPGRWPYPGVITLPAQVIATWDSALAAQGVVFGPRATRLWLGWSSPNQVAPEAMSVNGLDALLRFATAKDARTAFEQQTAKDAKGNTRPAAGPASIPDTDLRCVEVTDAGSIGALRFYCRIRYGHYEATILAREPQNMRQKAAAAYGLLVNGSTE
ncbi:hypothetical protein [Nocardia sp. NPDC020380]|uniref:DUF7373 family lipoprotein n=1 Tax=Nocardia sp. NPDC020380 TaxID=3364309 RepID=UPI0037A04D28